MSPSISDVFGVNDKLVLSYIDRPNLTTEFLQGLADGKHIIVYGASKQGKSYLRKKHLSDDKYLLINCGPHTTIVDIYTSIARQENVEIVKSRSYGTSQATSVVAKAKFAFKLPFVGETKAEIGADSKKGEDNSYDTVVFEFNLNNAQDLCELLHRYNFSKTIVLENFHYLQEAAQETMAIDLRTFNDHGIQFIILGVWRERNRLTQYNGELQGRIVDIPVEPWESSEFDQIAAMGAQALNISFQPELVAKLSEECFDSVGIFQELCKRVCIAAGVSTYQEQSRLITDHNLAHIAIQAELKNYGQRHIKSFRSFITKSEKDKRKGPSVAYYVAKAILQSKFNEIVHGLSREHLQRRIKSEFPKGAGPKLSELGSFLHNILEHQQVRSIKPPLFDYDEVERVLRVIDSTLFFYLKHNKERILSDITESGGT